MHDGDIPLSQPDITEVEIDLVARVLRSGRLSIGPMVERFERMVAERARCQHAVAVSSGTAGLHAVLLALGIGPGDEVITTPFSFIASANCILMAGATPVFVDIEPNSLNMDPALIEDAITHRTKAILGVETFGNPTHMDVYAQIAAKHEIPMIEDCCEALGTSLRGRPCGSFGRAGVFGFYPNKQITTGEGGMIVTDDARLAEHCRSLRNQGRGESMRANQGTWLRHERLGYNYRLNELSAALGVGQMTRLDQLIERRQKVANTYINRLLDFKQLTLPTVDEQTSPSWFVFVVRLATSWGRDERDRIIQQMRGHDVGAADYFPCIHLQPFYRTMFGYSEGDFPVAESVSDRTIALPFSSKLSDQDIDMVVQTLGLMLSREDLRRS
jgi:perosamine synthetase